MGMVGRDTLAPFAMGTTSAAKTAVMPIIVFMIIRRFLSCRPDSIPVPAVVDIEVHPFREQYRMLLVADHLRLDEHVAKARIVQLDDAVDLDHAPELAIELVPLRRGGHALGLLVGAVPLRALEASIVVLVAVGPVEELHEIVAVGIIRDPRGGPGQQLARALLHQLLGKLVLGDLYADPDPLDRLLPQLVDLAIA